MFDVLIFKEKKSCAKNLAFLSWVISSLSEKKYALVFSFAHNLDSKDKLDYLMANHKIMIILEISKSCFL